MSNILIIATDFKPNPGGIAEYTYNIAKTLHSLGEKVTILTKKYISDEEFDKNCELNIIRFEAPYIFTNLRKRIINDFYRLKIVYQTIKRIKPDVIYCSHYMELSLYIVAVSKMMKIPYFTTAYGLEISLNYKRYYKRNLERGIFFKNAKKVFCISKFTKDKILRLGIRLENAVVVPCGVDLKVFRKSTDKETLKQRYNLKNKRIILTVSRLIERKGIDTVIKAMPEIIKKVPETVYVVAGKGEQKDNLQNIAKHLNVDDKVVFTGYISENEKIEFLNVCDLFIMTPRELDNGDVEGFGIVFLEANACEKPVIGGNSGGVEDAIINNYTGLLVDPTNIGEIADSVVFLLENREVAKRLGVQGRKRVEKSLNWRNIVQMMRNEIKNALEVALR